MKPPEEDILRMLADGYLGEISSMLMLGAAMAIKRGTPIDEVKLSSFQRDDGSVDESIDRAMKAQLVDTHAFLVGFTPDEIDCSIALAREHLRRAGYSIDEGMFH